MDTMRSPVQIWPLLLLLCIATSGMAQTGAWTQVDRSDLLHQTSFKEFTLTGKFLVPPRQSSLAAPLLVLHCQPGRHGKYLTNGHFVEGWIATGAVLNSTVLETPEKKPAVRVPVEYRLDDKKLQSDAWNVSTDHSGVFVDDGDLDNLLYGHILLHTSVRLKVE